MIDTDGFRPNVGIVIANSKGQVFWGRRIRQDAWQFPQGGIAANETPEQALYRELEEEVGLNDKQVKVLTCTKGWLRYRLPQRLLRHGSNPLCIGQKQKWFLLQMLDNDDAFILDRDSKPEFDYWRWVSYWYPLEQVVAFKRDVYRRAMKELSPKHSYLVREQARRT